MDESDAGGGITRAELLKTAAVAVPGMLLGGAAAAAAPGETGRFVALGRTRGLRRDERAPLRHRPAAGDPALPARLGPAQPARPDAFAARTG